MTEPTFATPLVTFHWIIHFALASFATGSVKLDLRRIFAGKAFLRIESVPHFGYRFEGFGRSPTFQ